MSGLYNDDTADARSQTSSNSGTTSSLCDPAAATPLRLTQAAATQPRQLTALTLQPPPSPPPFPASSASDTGSTASAAASPAPAAPTTAAAAASFAAPKLTPTSAAIVFPMHMESAFTQTQPRQQTSDRRTPDPALPPRSEAQRAPTSGASSADPRLEAHALPPRSAAPSSVEALQALLQRSALQAGLPPPPPAAAAAPRSSYFAQPATQAAPAQPTPAARPAAPIAQPSASVAEASVLALADALTASMSRSHSRPSARAGSVSGTAAAAPPSQHQQRNDRDSPAPPAGSSVEHQLHQLRGRFDSELASKDRAHTYAQADLLTAFQLDREQTDRKHAEELEALRTEVAQRESDLTAHQSLYANYSERIQAELAELRNEVLQAQNELLAREEQAAVQANNIAALEAQLADQHRQRQVWESELVQRSNAVLLTKQESFDADRLEWEALQQQLSAQLHLQIESRASFEARLHASETKRVDLESRLAQAETSARNFEAQARQSREQNLEVNREFAASQAAVQTVTADAQALSAALGKLQREYAQLESLYNASTTESSARIAAFKDEAARSAAGYAAELGGHERALREVARCRADRVALHHSFLVFLRKRQLQTMLFRWIACTRARVSRNRAMQQVARSRARAMKQQALHRWKLFRISSNATKQLEESKAAATEQLQQRQAHFAEAFHASHARSRSRGSDGAAGGVRSRKAEVFQKWVALAHKKRQIAEGRCSDNDEDACCNGANRGRNRDRSRSRSRSRGRNGDRSVSPSSGRSCSHGRSGPADADAADAGAHQAAAAAASERQKKVELYHVLQSERAQWAAMQERYEGQLLSCEKQGWQQHQQIESLQAAVASLSKQQELETKWKQFEREEKKAASMQPPQATLSSVAADAAAPAVATAPLRSGPSAQAATISSTRKRSPSPRNLPAKLPPCVPEEPSSCSGAEGLHQQELIDDEDPISSRAARPLSPTHSQFPRASPLRRGYAALATAPSPGKSASSSSAHQRSAARPLSPSSLRSHVNIPGSGLPPHHHLDVTGMLSEIEAAQAAREAKLELREIQTEINAEQARLAVLAQLRRERDQAEAVQARMGPSFLAARMPTSPLLPLDGERRILTDARAAQLDPHGAPRPPPSVHIAARITR